MGERLRRPKRPRDIAQLAKAIVDEATGQTPKAEVTKLEPELTAEERHNAAVALGRAGGKKGGKVRAAKMTPEQRAESSRRAAIARWAKQKD